MRTTSPTQTTSVSAGAGRKFSKARQLAAAVGVSKRTLFRWADAGHVTRHKVNERVVLFDEAEVFQFIEASATGAGKGVAA